MRAGELKQLKPPSALRGTNCFPPGYPIRQPDKQEDEKPQETQRFLVRSPAYSHCIIYGQKIEIRSAPGSRWRAMMVVVLSNSAHIKSPMLVQAKKIGANIASSHSFSSACPKGKIAQSTVTRAYGHTHASCPCPCQCPGRIHVVRHPRATRTWRRIAHRPSSSSSAPASGKAIVVLVIVTTDVQEKTSAKAQLGKARRLSRQL